MASTLAVPGRYEAPARRSESGLVGENFEPEDNTDDGDDGEDPEEGTEEGVETVRSSLRLLALFPRVL